MISFGQSFRQSFRQALKPGIGMVELIFYIMIIAILMLGAVTGYNTIVRKAKVSTTKSNLQLYRNSIDSYYNDVQPNRYPSSLQDLVTSPEGVRGWDGPYLDVKEVQGEKQLPTDGWGNEYHYEVTPGQAHPYELYSGGAAGEDAPEEDWISVWS